MRVSFLPIRSRRLTKEDSNGDVRPRKRVRVGLSQDPAMAKEVTEIWWDVASMDTFAGNGLPPAPYCLPPRHPKHLPALPHTGGAGPPAPKSRKKKMKVEKDETEVPGKQTMLALMSENIRTVKRVRRAHAKLAMLAVLEDLAAQPGAGGIAPAALMQPVAEDAGAAVKADEGVDDRPWRTVVGGEKGKTRRRVGHGVGKVDGEAAEDCMKWMSGRVLEHAGFQGTLRSPTLRDGEVH